MENLKKLFKKDQMLIQNISCRGSKPIVINIRWKEFYSTGKSFGQQKLNKNEKNINFYFAYAV
jgi:hypothetical protein